MTEFVQDKTITFYIPLHNKPWRHKIGFIWGVFKIRNMEHSGAAQNIPEHETERNKLTKKKKNRKNIFEN